MLGQSNMRLDQQHQRRRILGVGGPFVVDIVERHVDQLEGLALPSRAGKIYPLAFVEPEKIGEFAADQRGRRVARSALCKGRRRCAYGAFGGNQRGNHPCPAKHPAQRTGDQLRYVAGEIFARFGAEAPDEVILAPPRPLRLDLPAHIVLAQREVRRVCAPFAPGLARSSEQCFGGGLLAQGEIGRCLLDPEAGGKRRARADQPVRAVGDRDHRTGLVDRGERNAPVGRCQFHPLCAGGLAAQNDQQGHQRREPAGISCGQDRQVAEQPYRRNADHQREQQDQPAERGSPGARLSEWLHDGVACDGAAAASRAIAPRFSRFLRRRPMAARHIHLVRR